MALISFERHEKLKLKEFAEDISSFMETHILVEELKPAASRLPHSVEEIINER